MFKQAKCLAKCIQNCCEPLFIQQKLMDWKLSHLCCCSKYTCCASRFALKSVAVLLCGFSPVTWDTLSRLWSPVKRSAMFELAVFAPILCKLLLTKKDNLQRSTYVANEKPSLWSSVSGQSSKWFSSYLGIRNTSWWRILIW